MTTNLSNSSRQLIKKSTHIQQRHTNSEKSQEYLVTWQANTKGWNRCFCTHKHPDARTEWAANATLEPFYPWGKDSVPIVQEAGWPLGPVWKGTKILNPHLISNPRPSVQPAASRYNDYCIQARNWEVNFTSGMLLCDYWRADGSYPTLHRLAAVWCSRELLLGSVPHSSQLPALRHIYRRSVHAHTKLQAVKPTCRRQWGVIERPCAVQIQLT
jgi:hypothetical protein